MVLLKTQDCSRKVEIAHLDTYLIHVDLLRVNEPWYLFDASLFIETWVNWILNSVFGPWWLSYEFVYWVSEHIKDIFYSCYQVERERDTCIIGGAKIFCAPKVLCPATSSSSKCGLKSSAKLQKRERLLWSQSWIWIFLQMRSLLQD